MPKDLSLLQKVFHLSNTGLIILNPDHQIHLCNNWILEHLPNDIKVNEGDDFRAVFTDTVSPRLSRAINTALTLGHPSLLSHKLNKHPLPLIRSDGVDMLQQVIIHAIEGYCLIQVFDVSESVWREKALQDLAQEEKKVAEIIKEREAHISAIFDSAQDSLITIDENGIINSANYSSSFTFGYSTERLVGKTISDILQLSDSDKDIMSFFQMDQMPNYRNIEMQGIDSSGKVFPVEISFNTSEFTTPKLIVLGIRDITERKAAEKQLDYLASHDDLTGLYNRFKLRETLKQLIKQTQKEKNYLWVLFLDLNNFRHINDYYGHNVGDIVLKQFATHLSNSANKNDIIARIGGDEFIIIHQSKNKKSINKTIDLIFSSMDKPIYAANQELYLDGTIGISTYPQDGEDIDSLIKSADSAMYHAKKDFSKPKKYVFFTEELGHRIEQRLQIERMFPDALAQGDIEIMYQPLINLHTQEVHGFEALSRWKLEDGTFLEPDIFIPALEETGGIIELGEYIIKEACAMAKQIHAKGFANTYMSINFSPIQFSQDNFMSKFIDIARNSAISPSYLNIEITENIFIDKHSERQTDKIHALAEAGFKLSIDDFGTGYSSLLYLKEFPINSLKIDRAFLESFPHDKSATSLIEAIISMGKSLGINIYAEGVEEQEQLQALTAAGCDYVQGFYIEKAIHKNDVVEWLMNIDVKGLFKPNK